MKILSVILIVTTFIFLSSCDLFNMKHDPKLPPLTTEGNDTFGCLVNGNLFLPEAPFGYGTGVYAELQGVNTDTVGINLYATNSTTDHNLIISIFDTPTLQVGKIYNLSDAKFFVDYTDYSNTPSCTYKKVISGDLKLLKFDITNPKHMIIAGIFEFDASSADCTDTVNVTQGRFDVSDFQ